MSGDGKKQKPPKNSPVPLWILLGIFALCVSLVLFFVFEVSATTNLPSQQPASPKIKIKENHAQPAQPEGEIVKEPVPLDELKLLTKEELKQHDGSEEGKPLYLAIVGDVFDVTEGEKHYGPEGGYSFFSGIDASRAYVTGEFNEDGLREDLEGLNPSQVSGVMDWHKFFLTHQSYQHIGRVIGYYYDENGQPTEENTKISETLVVHQQNKITQEEQKKRYPPCNSAYDERKGSKLWCSKLSGGVDRPWKGYPRILFDKINKQTRCGCVQDPNDPNPDLSFYEGCDRLSDKCQISKDYKKKKTSKSKTNKD